MLSLYLDDGGERERAVGGCIADTKAWDAFEPAWRTVLQEFHVEWFHAVDFEAQPGRGRDEHRELGLGPMQEDERDEFRSRLGLVLQHHVGLPVAEAVESRSSRWGGYVCAVIPPGAVVMKKAMKDRDRLGQRGRPQPSSGRARWLEDVVSLAHDAYGHCLQRAFLLAAETFALPLGEAVHACVANQPRKNGLVTRAYEIARASPRFGNALHALSYGKAADFAAYYLTKARRDPKHLIAQTISAILMPQRVEFSDGLYDTHGYVG